MGSGELKRRALVCMCESTYDLGQSVFSRVAAAGRREVGKEGSGQ